MLSMLSMPSMLSMLSMLSMRYRPNAALILLNDHGEILLGERLDTQGSWQFPQGGAKPGEPLDRTLIREAREEIGLRADFFEIIESHGPYRYQFPRGLKKNGCIGQEQMYFLSRLRPGYRLPSGPVNSPEFRRIRWIVPTDFQIDWVAEFKREVYGSVFREVLGVELARLNHHGAPHFANHLPASAFGLPHQITEAPLPSNPPASAEGSVL